MLAVSPNFEYIKEDRIKGTWIVEKDRIVITGGDTTGHSGNTNLIKIEEI